MTDLLTKADLGARLQISRATLNRWLRDGALPPPLPTPTARWIWDDVLEHLKGLRTADSDVPDDHGMKWVAPVVRMTREEIEAMARRGEEEGGL